jgi:CheY-like chemotaxis protein
MARAACAVGRADLGRVRGGGGRRRDARHGAHADGPALVAAITAERPDVSVVDVRMPPSHTDEGLRAAVEARSLVPDAPILILSQYVEERYAGELLATGSAGVGYLLKDRVADVRDFLAALEQVAAGGTVLDPEVVSQLLVRRRSTPLDELTDREREVLSLMAQGAPTAPSRRRSSSPRAPSRSTSETSSPSSACRTPTPTTAASSRCSRTWPRADRL